MILSERNRRAEIFWTYADDFFLPGGESDELEHGQAEESLVPEHAVRTAGNAEPSELVNGNYPTSTPKKGRLSPYEGCQREILGWW